MSQQSTPKKERQKRARKLPRTVKTKNGFKYKLKIDQFGLDSSYHPKNAGGVQENAKLNKVETETLRQNIKAFDSLVF